MIVATAATLVGGQAVAQASGWPWQDTTVAPEVRVEQLLQQLTLDEKLSLMVHQNPAIERLGLPAYSWWNEALHGVGRAGRATVYPMPIALAATFNTPMVEQMFRYVADEARRKHCEARDTGYFGDYAGLTFFTPNINIFRDPRWGRGMETYGEDPFLTAQMGMACVQGLQNGGAAACLKHLAVHSGPEGLRHEFDSRVTTRDLRTTYLPAFEYIIRNTKVAQVMCGYNRLNGEPCCTSRELLVDILRHEWQYEGLLVTDCWALNDAYERDTVIPRHRSHASAALAYGDAFGTEVDLECGSGLPALREAVRYGYIDEEKIDEHVRRILRTRLAVTDRLGRKMPEARKVAPVDVAAQSMVLLKNNGILPLHRVDCVQLVGPNASDSLMPLGNYNGTPLHCVTLQEALGQGAAMSGGDGRTVVYAGGLNPQLEGEELPVEKDGFYKGDRTRIELPQEQVEEIKRLKDKGMHVVLVLCGGSAIGLEEVVDYCDAVLVGWYGGEAMGTAVKQLLYGERDDFGRLPVTFYRNSRQLPPFDDYAMEGRTYRYLHEEPLYPFGYGLNYSHFSLGDVYVSEEDWSVQGTINLEQAATPLTRAVVQVYLKHDASSEEPMQLVGFCSVDIAQGHPRAGFRIEMDSFWFRQYNSENGVMQEPTEGTPMTLMVGFSSREDDLIEIPFIYHAK